MKLLIVVLATVVAMVAADCDSSEYKKIGCFSIEEQAPDAFQEIDDNEETFNIENYKDVLPRLVCDCFNKAKDSYKYFSIGNNGHCHGSATFHGNRRNNESGCIASGEHSAGLQDHEYVYQIKADAATPIDGGASDFGPWGECSKTCGGGKRSRERACIQPLPNDPGKGCDDLTEIEDCNSQPCPIDGSWGEWSDYEQCNAECGPGSQKRTRDCDSPEPQYDGKMCEGEGEESKACNLKPCPIDGGWSLWSAYTQCSASCGKGIQERSRSCNKPTPQHNGKECDGDHFESRTCVLANCVNDAEKIDCEDKDISLSCSPNWTLKIKTSSYYGRTDNDRCTRFYNINWNTNCKIGQDKMAEKCDGKQSCQFNCGNGFFGDPCWGTKKYCNVQYQCIGYDE